MAVLDDDGAQCPDAAALLVSTAAPRWPGAPRRGTRDPGRHVDRTVRDCCRLPLAWSAALGVVRLHADVGGLGNSLWIPQCVRALLSALFALCAGGGGARAAPRSL